MKLRRREVLLVLQGSPGGHSGTQMIIWDNQARTGAVKGALRGQIKGSSDNVHLKRHSSTNLREAREFVVRFDEHATYEEDGEEAVAGRS